MKSYHLVEKFCSEKNKIVPGKYLGDGFHGEVFEVKDNPALAVKYSCVSEAMCAPWSLMQFYENVRTVLDYQQRNEYPCYVKVIDFDLLHYGTRTVHLSQRENFILYFVLMEKLNPLTADEKKLIKTLCKAIENNKHFYLKSLVKDQHGWLEFDLNKVNLFLDQVDKSVLEHGDFRHSNIMTDSSGNFKLIDLDISNIEEM